MDNKSSFSNMNKGTILIIILLFMFSTKILDVVWDIGKALLYIIVLVNILTYLNPQLAIKIKEIINDFINLDSKNNFLIDSISKISFMLLNYFKPTNLISSEYNLTNIGDQTNNIGEQTNNIGEQTNNISKETIVSQATQPIKANNDDKNLNNIMSNNNNKNLLNELRNYSKNTYN
jgi:hypothetical protein